MNPDQYSMKRSYCNKHHCFCPMLLELLLVPSAQQIIILSNSNQLLGWNLEINMNTVSSMQMKSLTSSKRVGMSLTRACLNWFCPCCLYDLPVLLIYAYILDLAERPCSKPFVTRRRGVAPRISCSASTAVAENGAYGVFTMNYETDNVWND